MFTMREKFSSVGREGKRSILYQAFNEIRSKKNLLDKNKFFRKRNLEKLRLLLDKKITVTKYGENNKRKSVTIKDTKISHECASEK